MRQKLGQTSPWRSSSTDDTAPSQGSLSQMTSFTLATSAPDNPDGLLDAFYYDTANALRRPSTRIHLKAPRQSTTPTCFAGRCTQPNGRLRYAVQLHTSIAFKDADATVVSDGHDCTVYDNDNQRRRQLHLWSLRPPHPDDDRAALDALLITFRLTRTPSRTRAGIVNYMQKGWPVKVKDDKLKSYAVRKTASSIHNGCMLGGFRVIIPKNCQQVVLKILHNSHYGRNRMISLARTKIWFPGMDKAVEEVAENCSTCVVMGKDPVCLPYRPTEHSLERRENPTGRFSSHSDRRATSGPSGTDTSVTGWPTVVCGTAGAPEITGSTPPAAQQWAAIRKLDEAVQGHEGEAANADQAAPVVAVCEAVYADAAARAEAEREVPQRSRRQWRSTCGGELKTMQ
ncbi:hypothetical protein OSTOST_19469 [Ostertagia ostertagi]